MKFMLVAAALVLAGLLALSGGTAVAAPSNTISLTCDAGVTSATASFTVTGHGGQSASGSFSGCNHATVVPFKVHSFSYQIEVHTAVDGAICQGVQRAPGSVTCSTASGPGATLTVK